MSLSASIQIGRCFVSKYALARYCPRMPMQNNCTPPKNMIMQASDGQPPTGSPQIKVLITITPTMRNDTAQKAKPKNEASESGAVENAMIPCSAYLNSFQNDHFVSPATLGTFLYGIQSVLNPTQPNMPFVKRLYSPMDRTASSILRFIMRKSRAPSVMSASLK